MDINIKIRSRKNGYVIKFSRGQFINWEISRCVAKDIDEVLTQIKETMLTPIIDVSRNDVDN